MVLNGGVFRFPHQWEFSGSAGYYGCGLWVGVANICLLGLQNCANCICNGSQDSSSFSGDMCTCAFDFALQSGGNLPLSSCAAFIGLLHQLERLSGWVVQWGLSGWFREASMGRGTTVKRLRVSQPGEACGNFITTVRSLYAIFNWHSWNSVFKLFPGGYNSFEKEFKSLIIGRKYI